MGEGGRVCPISQRMTLRHSSDSVLRRFLFWGAFSLTFWENASNELCRLWFVYSVTLFASSSFGRKKKARWDNTGFYFVIPSHFVAYSPSCTWQFLRTSLYMCSDSVTILTTGIPNSLYGRLSNEWWMNEWWFSHDVTKTIDPTEILLSWCIRAAQN